MYIKYRGLTALKLKTIFFLDAVSAPEGGYMPLFRWSEQ